MIEIWKKVEGFKDKYSISNYGRLRNDKSLRILKQWECYGYKYVGLHEPNKYCRFRVHKLVATYFIGNSDGKQINHKDGDKSNNFVENLEYVTCSENIIHAYRIGLKKVKIGGENHCSKINEKDVLKIREEYKSGIFQKYLSKKYGISQPRISAIVNRKDWVHV